MAWSIFFILMGVSHVLSRPDLDNSSKGWANESDISDRFGIQMLPTKILIDPAGVIIGRYGDEEKNSTKC